MFFASVDFWLSIDEVKTAMVLSCQRAGIPVLRGDGINFSSDVGLLKSYSCISLVSVQFPQGSSVAWLVDIVRRILRGQR